jgi:hypothetical protein
MKCEPSRNSILGTPVLQGGEDVREKKLTTIFEVSCGAGVLLGIAVMTSLSVSAGAIMCIAATTIYMIGD